MEELVTENRMLKGKELTIQENQLKNLQSQNEKLRIDNQNLNSISLVLIILIVISLWIVNDFQNLKTDCILMIWERKYTNLPRVKYASKNSNPPVKEFLASLNVRIFSVKNVQKLGFMQKWVSAKVDR